MNRFRPTLALSTTSAVWLATVGLFTVIFAAKLAVLGRFGSDLPFWDQWAKEGELLFAPWIENGELWRNLFLPHNEHRIAPTLALNLALLELGGQWDARVQCLASAVLHASIGAAVFAWAARWMTGRWLAGLAGVLIAVAALPLAWDNVIGGFQSQFYFLIGFTVLALHRLLGCAAGSLGWWLGVFFAAAAIVSMGSGFLVGAPLVLIGLARWAHGHSRSWRALMPALCGAVIVATGFALRTPAPWHEGLQAQTPWELIRFATHCLAWPWTGQPLAAIALWLPWLILVWIRVRDAAKADPVGDLILAVGGWALLQIAAVAYSRGAGGGMPANRYGDVFAMGVLASYAAIAWSARTAPRRAAVLAATFALCLAIGAATSAHTALTRELPERKRMYEACERTVREFLATGEEARLAAGTLPFPIADWLARILRRESIAPILPASVRQPLEQKGAIPTRVSALSRTAVVLCASAAPIGIMGAALLLGGLHLHRKRVNGSPLVS